MAREAGGIFPLPGATFISDVDFPVPAGILSVLPGGPVIGKEIVSHPAIRKVDITVCVQW
jgi:acyl-CoA reductase-like NAD-dependent aldehyde dehydrogenase